MLEYGIKAITTNPTLITKADEIIKLVDSRTKKTRAFVVPVEYADYIEKISKEIEYKKWVEEKKKLLKNSSIDEDMDELALAGAESISEYLGDS